MKRASGKEMALEETLEEKSAVREPKLYVPNDDESLFKAATAEPAVQTPTMMPLEQSLGISEIETPAPTQEVSLQEINEQSQIETPTTQPGGTEDASQSESEVRKEPRWTPEKIAKSKAEMFAKTREKIDIIREAYESQECNTKKSRNAFLYINNTYFGLKQAPLEDRLEMRNEIVAIFIETKFLPIAVNIFSSIFNDWFSIRSSEEESSQVSELVRGMRIIQGIFFNYSDMSSEFCRVITDEDDLLEVFLKATRELRTDHMDKKLDVEINKFLRICTAISYNLVMHKDLDLVDRMHDFGLVSAIRPYLNSHEESIRISSLLFMIYVVNEQEASECCSDERSLRFVIKNLSVALHDKYKRGKGYSNMELMRALAKMAALDVNKVKLAEFGAVDLMKEALEIGNEEEVSAAIEILWQLAFHPDNARQIQSTSLHLIEPLASQEDNMNINRAANGLLWVLEEKAGSLKASSERHVPPKSARSRRGIQEDNALTIDGSKKKKKADGNYNKRAAFFKPKPAEESSRAPPPPPAPQGGLLLNGLPPPPPPEESAQHIMISYEWGSQKKIVKLKEILAQHGHKVWLDLDNMAQNTLDSMAFAVENAWLVLVSVSRKYKESQNCRLEAEYAFRLKKNVVPLMMERYRPDGWLGFLVGAKLYYDFSGKYNFDTKASELLAAIAKIIGGDVEKDLEMPKRMEVDGGSVDEPTFSSVDVTPQHAPPPPKRDIGYLDAWGAADVNKWCCDNGLEWANFMSITGKELKFLVRVKGECPDFFYRCLETKLQLKTLTEMAKFVDAVDRL